MRLISNQPLSAENQYIEKHQYTHAWALENNCQITREIVKEIDDSKIET